MIQQDSDDWDKLLQPFEDSIHQGERQGKEAAFKAGFEDGFQLGKVKALEIGMELGYIRSIVSHWMSHEKDGNAADHDHAFVLSPNQNENHQDEQRVPLDSSSSQHMHMLGGENRKWIRMKDLLTLMDSFPSPDVIFQSDDSDSVEQSHDIEGPWTESCKKGHTSSPRSRPSSTVDMVHDLQKIRAKFKALSVQMKAPHLTLKNIMNMSSDHHHHNTMDDNTIGNDNNMIGGTKDNEMKRTSTSTIKQGRFRNTSINTTNAITIPPTSSDATTDTSTKTADTASGMILQMKNEEW